LPTQAPAVPGPGGDRPRASRVRHPPFLAAPLLGAAIAAGALSAGKVPVPEAAAQAAALVAFAHPDRVTLAGNVHPRLASARELGPADAQAPMERMILVLKRTPEAEARLEALLAAQQDPESPDYHRWLTPGQFGARFGPAQGALDRVTGWLEASGFSVDEVAAGRMTVNFSGTVGTVERAFQTSIRRFELDGQTHQANVDDPSIPEGLAEVIAGVVSLHDLAHPALNLGFRPLPDPAPAAAGPADHPMVPGDFAAIYNVTPLHRSGLDGTGVSIAVVGRTHIPLDDTLRFRRLYGLPARAPEILINGRDPGDLGAGENGEANLDVQWSGAVAPNASIRLVVSATTGATDGVDLSAQYIVDHNLAPVMTTSFGQCEDQLGRAELAFYRNLWVQAAVQGITSCVASGDSGPAGCNGGSDPAGAGPAVSGLASTPFNLAVGGTQFNEGSGSYWRAGKDPYGASALGYIPEVAWNQSGCMPGGSGLWATGGGTSGIYRKPCWQMAPGVPCDSRWRAIPDLSLTASSHDGYVIQSGGLRLVTGGTSCSCPAFAGLMALVVQKTGERQGNPAGVLYKLGSAQFKGTGPEVFHDILAGGSTVPGTPGYPCTPGFDLATGLGSVDAQALVDNWHAGLGPNVDAVIQEPAGDLAVACGAPVSFRGLARSSQPGAALTCAWDFGDGTTATGAACVHHYRRTSPADAPFQVSFTAADGTGAEARDLRSLRVTPPPPPGERLVNGGFENGDTGWSQRGVAIGASALEPPLHGNGAAWFAGWLTGSTSLLQQSVRLPAGPGPARLTYWLHIDSSAPADQPYDTLEVKARGRDGVLAVLASFSNLDAAPGYRQHSLDLGAYRGQDLELAFVACYHPLGRATSFVLDDLSLIAP